VYGASWLWNERLLACARDLVETLGRAGIEGIALKGLALVMTSYRDVGVRPMGDIDILVPAGSVGAAAQALRGAGWTPGYALTPGFVRVRHAAPFRRSSAEECDLHWRIFEEAGGAALDDDWRAQAVVVDFRGTRFRVLRPEDQLLHVCVHASKWAPLPATRWVADALAIVRAGGVHWPRLVTEARARRFVLRTRQALCYLSTAMNAPVPAAVLQHLSRLPVSPLERFEHRVRNRQHPVLGELATYWCNYLRARPRAVLRPLGFARYLQDAWDLESITAVPRRALTLAARRVAMRRPASPAS
jgi:hypothetical protein